MSLFNVHPILQCDGGGEGDDDESSSEEGDTSDTSVDSSNDEEESDESSEEDEQENQGDEEEEVKRTNTKGSPSFSSATTTPGRERVTRQYARDQLPTKRLLRSRKKSPAAGSGSKQSQIFPCPNCKKEFNNKSSVNRHIRWCKPKNTNRTPKKKVENKEESGVKSSGKTRNSTKRTASTSKESSNVTPDGNPKRKRGRPKKSDTQSPAAPPIPITTSNLFHEEHIPEDDFMLQRSPESSPGLADTSSESDYEQREFAANAHHLNNNRNRGISIDVENPDQDEDVEEEEQTYQVHQQSQATYMEVGQEEMVLQANGPVTCQKCGMTYRNRQGYDNHVPSCLAYSSSEEDEEVDVVDDSTNNQAREVTPSWNQSSNSMVQNAHQNLESNETNSSLPEQEEEESSERISSSSDNESQDKPSTEQVQIPQIAEGSRSNFMEKSDNEVESGIQSPEKKVPIANVVVNVPLQNLAMVDSENVLSVERSNIPLVMETPVMTPERVQRENHSIPFPIQVAQSQLHNSTSMPSQPPPPPSGISSVTTVLSPQVQQFIPSPIHSQGSQNHQTPPPPPPQYNFTSMSSSATPHSTPLLHHAQASSNTPTYTQAQLMPGTVLHNSVMQAQQQMSTSAGPPSTSECYQPVGPQPPQLLVNSNMTQQPVLRVQNSGLNGSFQLPQQQLQTIPHSGHSVVQQHQQTSAFANVPQQQIFRPGGGPVMVDQRMQPAVMSHLPGQQHSLPQQVPISGVGHPSGQFPSGLPEQFQYLNGNAMPPYSFQMPQQAHPLQQQFQSQQQPPQQIGGQLQNFPNQHQPQQGPPVQQSMSMHVPNPNLNTMGSQQQMMAQPEPPNSVQNGNGTQFQAQQNPMQFQYFQNSIPKLMADPHNGMASLQQMVQNGFNSQQQQQSIGSGPIPPTVQYQMQQQPQPMFQPQQQLQPQPPSNPSGSIVPGQQLNPQMFQSNFQNSMIQGPTSSDLQQEQNHTLQQHQMYQMQMQQGNQPQLQVATNDAQKTSQSQLNSGQLVMNSSGGLQWNKPGMQLISCPQQLQRPSNPQQPSPQAGLSPQQHQIQGSQLQLPNSASQQITQVIQQIAQITDGSGNTYCIIMAPPQQQNGGLANTNSPNNLLNLIPGLQNVQSTQQQPQIQPQQQQQQNAQLAHCALQSGVNSVVNQAASHGSGVTPPGSAGRSGPCPCPSCKEKLGTANAMEKFKKVLPYPSAHTPQHSPTDQLKPILPNLGATTRPILIRPAGSKPPKPIRAQKISPDAQLQVMQQQNMTPPPLPPPQQTSPMRVLPLAMKMVMPSTTPSSSSTVQQQLMTGAGVIIDGNPTNRGGGVPTSSPNIAVVRPMENPLQKLTDQISQIETSFMAPPTYQQQSLAQHQGSPQPQQLFQQQAASPIMVPQQQRPQGPHLTLVTASPPPSAAIQAPLISTVSPNQLQQLVSLPNGGSPIQQGIVQNLQPRLMLVDHGSPVSAISPNMPPAQNTPSTTPVKTTTTTGVKRKLDPSTATDSSNKSIKLTLKRKEGDDSYSINSISGSTSASGTMKSLKIKGHIKSGEQAGTSSDVLVVPCIHTVPVPDPDADDAGGNRTIAEDAQGTEGAAGPSSGENNNEVKASKGRLLHRAVIVYEVQSNDTVLFRSSDVRAVWGYILETVQGQRLNHNLPPLPYPTTDISLPHNDPEADAAFNKLGLTHRAVQFLLEELKTLLVRKQMPNATTAGSSSPDPKDNANAQATLPTSSSSSRQLLSLENGECKEEAEDDTDVPLQENLSGCARTERFIGRKPFDMFGWLASRHRKPVPCNSPMELTRRLTAPLSSRFRKPKERQDGNLILAWSQIHGRGLFTTRDFEKGDMIIEYAGEVIRPIICDIREKYYESKSMGCYMFRIKDHVIDATMKGNSARFINHSCEPNCEAKTKEMSGKARIFIYALARICRGEELTYDYKFDPEEEKIPCSCGSKHCRKYLN